MDITRIVRVPTHLLLAGVDYEVSEFTISDLAALQAWIKAHRPHPLDRIKGQLEGLADADRRVLLLQAYDDAKRWPPKVGSTEGNEALLGCHEGVVEFVRAAIATGRPGTTSAEAETLLKDMSADNFSTLLCVAFGVDPQAALEGLLSPKAGAATARSTGRKSSSSSPPKPKARSARKSSRR